MSKPARPVSVTLTGYLFIISGIMGIVYHAAELKQITDDPELIWVFVVRALAIVGGVFALRGANWARWLLITWIVYHVGLSFYHTFMEVAMHAIIAVGVAFALFNPKSNKYFLSTKKVQ